MAKITNIKDVINNASRKIYIIVGESNNKTHTVNSNSEWVGDIWVPWIKNQDESNKAIRITIEGEPGTTTIWVFQDYLNPPNKDQVKYHKGKEGKQVVKFNII
ncbi:hypothetical protein [Photorhabdus sp. RM323S]|uniref:hypothetical protein n=1 Tax=Photorhabdus sp. RM323S TaxID=3342828 RepID=UPI0036DE7E53